MSYPKEKTPEDGSPETTGFSHRQDSACQATVEDIDTTSQLIKAAQIIGISVLDRVIVAETRINSLRKNVETRPLLKSTGVD